MTDAGNDRRSDRLRTEGIFRRALGSRHTASFDTAGMTLAGRTEPTLDAPAPREAAPPPNVAPTRPAVDDRQLIDNHAPMASASQAPSYLRWALMSTLTLLLSLAIGLALLIAPGGPLNINDSPSMRALLPSWVTEGLLALDGRAAPSSAPAQLATAAGPMPPIAAATPAAPPVAAPPVAAPPIAVPSPAVTSTDAASATGALTSTASTTAAPTTAAPTTAAPTTATSTAATSTAAASAASATLAPPRASTSEAAARKETSKPVSASLLRAAPPRATKPAAKIEADAHKTIRKAPSGSFFVQHVSLGSEAQARAWRLRHPALSQAKIVTLGSRGKDQRFAVVSGPFATRKAAEAFAARQGIPVKSWVRPQPSLKSALPAPR